MLGVVHCVEACDCTVYASYGYSASLEEREEFMVRSARKLRGPIDYQLIWGWPG